MAVADWSLSPLDISFLSVETRTTPMTIGAVALLERAAHGTTPLAEVLGTRATRIPRLRRRLRADWFPPVGASWVEDPDFAIEAHVRPHPTVGAGGDDELHAWVARTMATPLTRERPLWEVHLLDGLCDGRTAVLLKAHHAFLDGLGIGALAYALADGGSPESVPGPTPGADSSTGGRAALRRLAGPLSGLADPVALARTAATAMSTVTGVITSVSSPGPGLPFDTVVSPARAFTTASLAVDDLRALRAVCNGTINDIGLAVVSGALRHWLMDRHYGVDQLRIRALVPVAGSRASAGGSGNTFSGFLLELPVHVPDPLGRLRLVAQQMRRHRAAGPEGGPGALANLVNLFPPALVRIGGPLLAGNAARLFDLLVTTVPAPRPLRMGGRAVREIYPLTPLGPHQPLALGSASYGGRLHVGVTADPIVVPDPAGLAAAIPAELAALHTAAGLGATVPAAS